MTTHFIAQVVENYYNKLSLEDMVEPWMNIKQHNQYGNVTHEWINHDLKEPKYIRWCQAIAVLERYCRQHFDSFQETELVYKWAEDICKRRNQAVNQWRQYGGYKSFSNYLRLNDRF